MFGKSQKTAMKMVRRRQRRRRQHNPVRKLREEADSMLHSASKGREAPKAADSPLGKVLVLQA